MKYAPTLVSVLQHNIVIVTGQIQYKREGNVCVSFGDTLKVNVSIVFNNWGKESLHITESFF